MRLKRRHTTTRPALVPAAPAPASAAAPEGDPAQPFLDLYEGQPDANEDDLLFEAERAFLDSDW